MTFRLGENKTRFDFVLRRKEHRRFSQNVKAIPGQFQHALVVADTGKKVKRNVVRKTRIERRIRVLIDEKIRKRY